jgi:UDP-2,3-diacylglucosamine hydrolase
VNARDGIVFVSDAHFGSGAHESERRASFLRFLESLHGTGRLFVVGDLFQFWFDLGRTIPQRSFDVLDGLYRLRRSGTRIDYLAGNHDYWRGPFFERELGIVTHRGEVRLEAQGRRVLVAHGDGTGPGDLGYKLLRRVVRSPLTIGLARLLHPDVLQALATGMGRLSRAHTETRPPALARLEAAARDAHRRGFDALVMGHVHVQLHRQLEQGELVVIGDWLDLRSFVRLEGGRFHAGRWQA